MNIDWRNHVADEQTNLDVRELVERRLHRVLRFFPHRVTAVRVNSNSRSVFIPERLLRPASVTLVPERFNFTNPLVLAKSDSTLS